MVRAAIVLIWWKKVDNRMDEHTSLGYKNKTPRWWAGCFAFQNLNLIYENNNVVIAHFNYASGYANKHQFVIAAV